MAPRNRAERRHPESSEPQPDLIGIPEAARRVGLHADTLYRLSREGRFPPAIQIGSKWRVSVPRLEKFLHGEPVAS